MTTAHRLDDVVVVPGRLSLPGQLAVPVGARGLVLFAHGSGSSRLSQRNRFVADRLHDVGLGTPALRPALRRRGARPRQRVRHGVARSTAARRNAAGSVSRPWPAASPSGTSVPARVPAQHLMAAAEDRSIGAVVSRGGRPDLAAARLSAVFAPTLLIVGGADPAVLELNEQASRRLRCEHRLVVIPGATHLFEEPGALEVGRGPRRVVVHAPPGRARQG